MADVVPDTNAVANTGPELLNSDEQTLVNATDPQPEPGAELIAGQGITDVRAAQPTSQSAEGTPVTAETAQPSQGSDSVDGQANTQSSGDPGSTTQTQSAKARGPVANVLNNYVSYTYNISLHMLTPKTYNQLLHGEYVPEDVLIVSAGRRGAEGLNNKFKRNKYWEEDFYFDKLNLSSVMGYNAKSKGSNIVKLEFDIVEPYGISLLDRLILTANAMEIPNYLLAPYLLQVEFFGYADETLAPLQQGIQRRMLPIKITTMDINFDARGTVYTCTAVPFNHWAFEQDIITLPVAAKVQVDKNPYLLREFFGTDKDQVERLTTVLGVNKQTDIRNQEEARREYEETIRSAGGPISDADLEVIRQDINKRHQVKPPLPNASGLGTILNSYYRYLAETEKFEAIPYTYDFVFQGALNDTNIISKGLRDFATTNSDAAKKLEETTVAVSGVNETPANEGVQLTFQRGTSILKIIEQFITISEYMTAQIDTINTPENKRKVTPLQLYKVTPKIILGDYDKKRNDFARNVTYVIQPSIVYNNRLPFGPQGAPTDDKVVKEYNYYYTGKNDEIIDLKINFQNAFVGTYTGGAVTKSQDSQRPEDTPDSTKETPLSLSDPTKFPARLIAKSANEGSRFDNLSELTVKSHDLFNNIFSRSQADMVNLSMTIRGDPSYIQEEDFMYFWEGSRPRDESDDRLFASGSLVVNDSQLLAKLQFRFPDDIDTETGLYTSNRNTEKPNGNLFSGIYIVVKVDSMFERGQFIQKLDMVKVFNDPQALMKVATDAENVRQQSQTEQNLSLEEQISQQEVQTLQQGLSDSDKLQSDFANEQTRASDDEESMAGLRQQALELAEAQDETARVQTNQGQQINTNIQVTQTNQQTLATEVLL